MKFKSLTSLSCRHDISGLCCHKPGCGISGLCFSAGSAEKQNIYFFLLSKFVFESFYGTEVKKRISLLFLSVCFFFFWVCLFCEVGWFLQHCCFCRGFCIIEIKCMRGAKIISLSFGFWWANGGHFSAYFQVIKAQHYTTYHPLCSS